MKLGISYPVFEGEELLEYTLGSIRSEVDFISVVWQKTSYFGKSASPSLESTLKSLRGRGLIDVLCCYEQDRGKTVKGNELAVRNCGLGLAREAGCTHHISADVDEMYLGSQLGYAKSLAVGCDCLVVPLANYYRRPYWRVFPDQGHVVPLIYGVCCEHDMGVDFPFVVDVTRRLRGVGVCRLLGEGEFLVHHMTYVRRDIRKKLENSPTGSFYKLDKFVVDFDKYELGGRLCIAPDLINRRTVLVENIFGIKEDVWERHQ